MWFNKKKNILITGAKGQLGSYLVRELTKMSFKKKSSIGQVFGIDIDDLDLTNSGAVADFFNIHVINPSVKLDYVIHCAAATNTSAIEQNPWNFFAANSIATRNVAESCAYNNIKLIHISTDYVFSEYSPKYFGSRLEFPVNQYGLQKLLAEKEVQIAFSKKPNEFMIGRLSWLFGNSTNSFVEKILRSIANTYAKKQIDANVEKICHYVANDAYGRPTPVSLVLDCILDAIYERKHGIVDFQYLNNPQISRYEWSMMIWDAFCNEVENIEETEILDDMKDIKDIVKDMKNKISIVGVSSSELKLSMKHPGLVVVHAIDKTNLPYVDCTNKYVHDNIKNLLHSMIESVK